MKITMIGAGNVGFHLGKRLFKKGIAINQVYSRTRTPAQLLAKLVQAEGINDLRQINNQSDIYILAVKDDALAEVAQQLAEIPTLSKKLVVHTSGAVPSTVLQPHFKKYGVFYPLQTFSKKKRISFKKIPICIDANKKKAKAVLLHLGNQISEEVHIIKDQERAILHVAAVFVNNFTNHLFHIAHQICQKEGLDFALLQPLIQETVYKIKDAAPYDMQTGPGRRGDRVTIQKHLTYLEKQVDYHNVYQLLSKRIEESYSTANGMKK